MTMEVTKRSHFGVHWCHFNVIQASVVPLSCRHSMETPIKLMGINCNPVDGGEEETKVYLEFSAESNKGRFLLGNYTDFLVAKWWKHSKCDGILSYQWLATNGMDLNARKNCLQKAH